MFLQMALFDFFFCIFVPHLLYPFICPCILRLLPCLCYYKQCCYKHWGVCIFSDFLNICPGMGLLDHMISIFSFIFFLSFFFEEASDCLHQFIFPPTVQECSLSFTSSLAFRPNNEFYSKASRLQSCAYLSCFFSYLLSGTVPQFSSVLHDFDTFKGNSPVILQNILLLSLSDVFS